LCSCETYTATRLSSAAGSALFGSATIAGPWWQKMNCIAPNAEVSGARRASD